MGGVGADCVSGLQAIQPRHADIHHDDVGPQVAGFLHRLLAVNRFAALKADIDIFTTFEGDNTVLTLLCARGILTGYAHEVGEQRNDR